MNPEDLKYAKHPKMNPELMNPKYLKTISQMSEKPEKKTQNVHKLTPNVRKKFTYKTCRICI